MAARIKDWLLRVSPGHLVAALALFTLVPLATLAYLTERRAEAAVREQAFETLEATAATSAESVRQELGGLLELVDSYALRPTLVKAMEKQPVDRRELARQLSELRAVRPGIGPAFATEPDGDLAAVAPATPELVGQNLSFRDWYVGITRTRGTYLSVLYQAGRGEPRVTAATAMIRHRGERPVGIIAAAYGVKTIQGFVDRLSAGSGVSLSPSSTRTGWSRRRTRTPRAT